MEIKTGDMVVVINHVHDYLNKGQVYKVIEGSRQSSLKLDIAGRNKFYYNVGYTSYENVKKIDTELGKILYG